MTDYLVVIEKAQSNFSAYLRDLPGCVATGETKGETVQCMRVAIELHIKGLKEDGLPVPFPSTVADYVVV